MTNSKLLKRITHILFSGIFLFSFQGLAQTASIEGIAYDKIADSPLESASVSIHQATDSSLINGILSASDGKFKFENLKKGRYFVKVRFLGYETFNSPEIYLNDQQKLDLGSLGLQVNQQYLNEVRVVGQQLQSVNKIDKQVYKAEQFQSAKGGTAIDVIKNMPSVSVNGQGDISLRGSQGFLVLINGKPVQTDASTMLSQLPANNIENIELITAPSAKYDPDGKGGIINITTKKGADDGTAFIFNIQGGLPSVEDYNNAESQKRYGADVTFNYKKNKWDISASTNYLRNDNAGLRDGDVYTVIENRKTTFPSHGERSFDKYNYGGRFNVNYTPNTANQFSVGFFAGHKFQDRLADIHYNNTKTDITTGETIGISRYFNSNLQNKQGNFILGNVDYTHTFTNKSALSFSILYEYADLHGSTKNRNIEQADTVQNTVSTYQNPLNGIRAKVDYMITIGPGKLESGYQYRRDEQDGNFIYNVKELGDTDFAIDPAFTGMAKAVNQIHSIYTQYAGTSGPLEYLGGLRYEYATRDLNVKSVDDNSYKLTLNNLFPSASALYTFNNNWKAKAGLSRRVQRTNNFELNPIPEREHSETLEQGDANLLPEFIYLAELGLIKTFNKGSFFSTLYYQDIENPIQRVNNVYADTILNRVYTNADRSQNYGIEIGANYTPAKWAQLYLGTNVYKSTTRGMVLDYLEKLENSAWVYSINANANFQLNSTLSLQGNVNYLSDRPTVQGEDSRFLIPNLSLKKTFMDGRLTALVQWQNIDMGLMPSNEQRITTFGPDFYTTTNYIYEVDVIQLNLSFTINKLTNKVKLPRSEFGEKEF